MDHLAKKIMYTFSGFQKTLTNFLYQKPETVFIPCTLQLETCNLHT
jgi:hypothetical protein